MTIGERIKYYRLQKGITQEKLATELYVSNQAVSKWERNVSLPDVSLIAKIAQILGVSCDALFIDSLDSVEKELREIIKKAEQISIDDREEYKAYVSLLEKTVDRFPKACSLKLALSEVYLKGIDFLDYTENNYVEKIIANGEYVLNYSNELSEWFRSIQLLCYTYRITGNLDRVRELASQMPTIEMSREALMYHALPDEEYETGIYDYIKKLLSTANAMASVLVYPESTEDITDLINKIHEKIEAKLK